MEVSNHNNGKDATFGAIKTLDVFSKKKKSYVKATTRLNQKSFPLPLAVEHQTLWFFSL